MTFANSMTLNNMGMNPFAGYSNTFVYNPSAGFYNSTNPYTSALNYANMLLKNINTNSALYNYKAPVFNYTFGKAKQSSSTPSFRLNGGFGSNIVNNAYKYIGYNESDNSYKLFTNGRTEAWCADFVSHVVKESCQQSGKSLPSGFGSASVENLRQWGLDNNCYLETASKTNKRELITQNVKPGDVIIFKENGKSHTGIFAGIDENGKIKTIEGNTSDEVAERTYAMNDATISGFVQIA